MRQRVVAAGLPAGPMAACVAVAMIVWLATGVRPLELLAFIAFQIVFVAGPGLVAIRLLRPADSALSAIALGWPLGFVLELLAFSLTAAVGARWLFFAYPVVALVIGIGLLRRAPGRRVAPSSPPPPAVAWATAVVTAVVALLIAVSTLAANPLPRSVPNSVTYTDLVFDVSLAADAATRWPITDPNVAGEPLRYHVLAFWDVAAFHQVTGVEIDVGIMRLQPLLAILLAAFLLAWLATRVVRGSPWVVPGAVGLMFLANELDLDPDRPSPFVGLLTPDLILSPTFSFGLIFFLAAAGLVLEVVRRPSRPPPTTWILLGAMFAAALGAKAPTLPILLGALGLFWAGQLVFGRRLDVNAMIAGGVGVVAFVVVYEILFSGTGATSTSTLDPFAFRNASALMGNFSGNLVSIVATAAVSAALVAPWLGALLLRGRITRDERTAALWLWALVVAGAGPFVLFSQDGLSQVYFFFYAAPPAALLSAWGIGRAWPALRAARHPWAAVAGAVALTAVAAIAIHDRTPGVSTSTPGRYLPVYLAVVLVVGIAAIAVERRLSAAFALAATALVALTLADIPIDAGYGWAKRRVDGTQARTPDARDNPHGMDRAMLAGLRWLRDHSAKDDVVASGTRDVYSGDSRYFYVAAFSERRTFVAGTDYTGTAYRLRKEGKGEVPFADRQALNAAAFAGDARALQTMHDRYGVRFLVVDLLHAGLQPRRTARLEPVYANRSIRIYRLTG